MTDDQKRILLSIARQAMMACLSRTRLPEPPGPAIPEGQNAGAFVSLHRGPQLRGCIGTFQGSGPIEQTVARIAAQALGDPRFYGNPVTADELPQLDIEISVLSPLQKTDDPLSLEVGKHGIYISRGHAAGCFLPQVAAQMRWDAETFLRECCRGKAGLAPDAWRDPATTVQLFTAEVFSEHELGRQ